MHVTRSARDMGRKKNVREAPQCVIPRQRFCLEGIKTGKHIATLKALQEGIGIYERAARNIDQNRARP
jgi:hypothetical protein